MENQIEKIKKKNNQLLLSKLDLLVKGQESNSTKLEVIGTVFEKVLSD